MLIHLNFTPFRGDTFFSFLFFPSFSFLLGGFYGFDKTCILKNSRWRKKQRKKNMNDPRHDCPRCSSNGREKRKRAEMKEDTKV